MGRKAKRLRLLKRIAKSTESLTKDPVQTENSVKIEELKAATPEPVIEESVKIEEPEVVEVPKPEIKKTPAKKATVKKAAPKKNTRAKTTSRTTKAKKNGPTKKRRS